MCQTSVKGLGMVGVDKMDQFMADHIGDAVKRGLHQLPGKGHPPFGGGAAAPAGGHGPHANLWHRHPKGGQLGLVLAAQLRGNGEAGLFQKGLHGLHPALRILRIRQSEVEEIIIKNIFVVNIKKVDMLGY